MKDRARKRQLWTFVRLDGPPFLYCGPIRGMRQALRKPDPWHIPNNPLDTSAWLNSVVSE